jgi:hypothetical protein
MFEHLFRRSMIIRKKWSLDRTLYKLVPLQLSNNVFCHAEVHYCRGTRPNGIHYHLLGLALEFCLSATPP